MKEILLGFFAESERVRGALGGAAQFVAVPEAGHLPHMERPELVNARVMGFLKQ